MLQQRLIIVGGKGGAGRTTVSCALALALARRGRRTLLSHVRCRQDLSRLLGGGKIGERIRPIEPDLWAVNMNPQAAIREMGLMVLRFRAVYRVVLENRFVRGFLRAVPALEEYSMVGKAWFHTTEQLGDGQPRYETVVFDGPATGHLISMLRIPQVILDAVPEGPLTADARKARALLSNRSKTAIWLVTLAEEMAATEARDLYRAATQELHISVDRLVVNSLYPEDLTRQPDLAEDLRQLRRAKDPSPSDALHASVRATETLHRRRCINDHYLRQLQQEIPLRHIELPRWFVPEVTRTQVEQLAERIGEALNDRELGDDGSRTEN